MKNPEYAKVVLGGYGFDGERFDCPFHTGRPGQESGRIYLQDDAVRFKCQSSQCGIALRVMDFIASVRAGKITKNEIPPGLVPLLSHVYAIEAGLIEPGRFWVPSLVEPDEDERRAHDTFSLFCGSRSLLDMQADTFAYAWPMVAALVGCGEKKAKEIRSLTKAMGLIVATGEKIGRATEFRIGRGGWMKTNNTEDATE